MKTNNKHTKGPWKVMGESTLSIISYHIPKGRKICSLLNQSTEDYKNAALIAAAPEMFEALEYAQECIEKGIKSDDFLWQLDALIKKARGE